jgi:Ferritin-like domain
MRESLTSSETRPSWSRGSFLRGVAGAGGAALGVILIGRRVAVSDAAPSPAQDRRIFQFALVLEELQSAFYSEAVERSGLQGDLREFAQVVGGHERAHVAFLRKVLGPAAGPAQSFHFGAATSNPQRFGVAARAIENLGVAAYNGQGAKLTAGAMEHAAEIVSVEGRHAGWIGALLGDPPAPRAADPGLDAGAVLAQLRASGYLG